MTSEVLVVHRSLYLHPHGIRADGVAYDGYHYRLRLGAEYVTLTIAGPAGPPEPSDPPPDMKDLVLEGDLSYIDSGFAVANGAYHSGHYRLSLAGPEAILETGYGCIDLVDPGIQTVDPTTGDSGFAVANGSYRSVRYRRIDPVDPTTIDGGLRDEPGPT